jgi:ubiquinone/menaquinone biosynthesis C-methylase UbiE
LGMRSDHRPGWLLDEVAAAGRENLDADHVARYDDKEDANAEAEVETLEALGLNEGSTLVDLGAGTGQLVLAAARRCGRVVAVDVSPLMLEVIRTKLRRWSLANVEVVQAGFLSYEHRGEPADFVYSRWALHHLPDFWKSIALTRMRAVVGVGGILRLSDIVYSFPPSEAADRIEQWCATLPDDAREGEWVRADIEEHVRDEHSTYTWLLEPMLERSGFRIDTVEYSADGFEAEYIATAV